MPIPTQAMREEAQRGLDWRKEYGRGGTEVGIARARDIVNGRDLSDDTIGRMVSFFARHEVNKEAEGFRPGEEGYPSNGRIAWALWGGDAGKAWAEREYSKIQKDRAEPDELKLGDFVSWNSSGGRARGQIEHIMTEGVLGIPDTEFSINATPEDPAALIRIWRDGEATEVLVGHRFSTLRKIQPIRSMSFDGRPYPNEHAARLRDPSRYDSFRRVNDEFGEGIDAIYGIMDNTSELQAIRFDKNRFTPQEARQWLDDNDFEPIEFEEAMEERKATPISHRSAHMETEVVDDRRVMMSISSEAPVERAFGVEVLDHSPESIDMSFLNSGRAPLLLDHDAEKQIGVIESVSLDSSARRLRATVRFSKNALAQEVYSDVADNIRGNVSIGYAINKMVKEKDGRTYRATSWRPVEASIVSIPADTSVGVGRSLEDVVAELNATEEPVMDTQATETEQVVAEAVVTEAVEATPPRLPKLSRHPPKKPALNPKPLL